MQRKNHEVNVVRETMVDEGSPDMTAVAINDQETLIGSSGDGLKYLGDPFVCKGVI